MSIKKHFAPLFSDTVWFIFCDTHFILRKLVTTLPVKEINLISAEGAIFSSPVWQERVLQNELLEERCEDYF